MTKLCSEELKVGRWPSFCSINTSLFFLYSCMRLNLVEWKCVIPKNALVGGSSQNDCKKSNIEFQKELPSICQIFQFVALQFCTQFVDLSTSAKFYLCVISVSVCFDAEYRIFGHLRKKLLNTWAWLQFFDPNNPKHVFSTFVGLENTRHDRGMSNQWFEIGTTIISRTLCLWQGVCPITTSGSLWPSHLLSTHRWWVFHVPKA